MKKKRLETYRQAEHRSTDRVQLPGLSGKDAGTDGESGNSDDDDPDPPSHRFAFISCVETSAIKSEISKRNGKKFTAIDILKSLNASPMAYLNVFSTLLRLYNKGVLTAEVYAGNDYDKCSIEFRMVS